MCIRDRHYGTYTAEVYRAGIENVPRGQWEAAKACNLNSRQTWTRIRSCSTVEWM